jgi:hypothetical protein
MAYATNEAARSVYRVPERNRDGGWVVCWLRLIGERLADERIERGK